MPRKGPGPSLCRRHRTGRRPAPISGRRAHRGAAGFRGRTGAGACNAVASLGDGGEALLLSSPQRSSHGRDLPEEPDPQRHQSALAKAKAWPKTTTGRRGQAQLAEDELRGNWPTSGKSKRRRDRGAGSTSWSTSCDTCPRFRTCASRCSPTPPRPSTFDPDDDELAQCRSDGTPRTRRTTGDRSPVPASGSAIRISEPQSIHRAAQQFRLMDEIMEDTGEGQPRRSFLPSSAWRAAAATRLCGGAKFGDSGAGPEYLRAGDRNQSGVPGQETWRRHVFTAELANSLGQLPGRIGAGPSRAGAAISIAKNSKRARVLQCARSRMRIAAERARQPLRKLAELIFRMNHPEEGRRYYDLAAENVQNFCANGPVTGRRSMTLRGLTITPGWFTTRRATTRPRPENTITRPRR